MKPCKLKAWVIDGCQRWHSQLFIVASALLILTTTLTALDVPKLSGRVVDEAKLLNCRQKEQVEAELKELETVTGGQMAVLTIDSLQGTPLEQFSLKVAEDWKIGHKDQDNGVLLLVVKNDRKIRLEIGYGWEEQITDAKAGDIIRNMQPYFRKGDYAAGITYAVVKVRSDISGKPVKYLSTKKITIVTWIAIIALVGILCCTWFLCVIKSTGNSGGYYSSSGYHSARSYGGYSGGSSGGYSGGGGGGFSGGGGSFGGGGASGSW